jgi:hypothetical protein
MKVRAECAVVFREITKESWAGSHTATQTNDYNEGAAHLARSLGARQNGQREDSLRRVAVSKVVKVT